MFKYFRKEINTVSTKIKENNISIQTFEKKYHEENLTAWEKNALLDKIKELQVDNKELSKELNKLNTRKDKMEMMDNRRSKIDKKIDIDMNFEEMDVNVKVIKVYEEYKDLLDVVSKYLSSYSFENIVEAKELHIEIEESYIAGEQQVTYVLHSDIFSYVVYLNGFALSERERNTLSKYLV